MKGIIVAGLGDVKSYPITKIYVFDSIKLVFE